MKKILLILLLVGIVVISGCTGETTYSDDSSVQTESSGSNNVEKQKAEPKTTAQTLGDILYVSAKNWDEDAELDGLEFDLSPRDANDNSVSVEGTLTVKLIETVTDYEMYYDFESHDADELGTWSNIKINKENYGVLGATVRLSYDDIGYTPGKSGMSSKMGRVEITFKTADGKTFQTKYDDIFLDGL